jgi:hypothetical protein
MIRIGGHCYHDHPEFWKYVDSLAGPEIVVVQDADDSIGLGPLFGEIHARVSRALAGVACVTNAPCETCPELRPFTPGGNRDE